MSSCGHVGGLVRPAWKPPGIGPAILGVSQPHLVTRLGAGRPTASSLREDVPVTEPRRSARCADADIVSGCSPWRRRRHGDGRRRHGQGKTFEGMQRLAHWWVARTACPTPLERQLRAWWDGARR